MADQKTDPYQVIVGVDVESASDFCIETPVAVGLKAIDMHDEVVDECLVIFPKKWPQQKLDGTWDLGDFGERCWHEFWLKHVTPEARAWFQKPTVATVEEGVALIAAFADRRKEKTIFTSDCPGFDFAAVNCLLERHGRRGVNWNASNQRHTIEDSAGCLLLMKSTFLSEHILKTALALHDHNPINDAWSHAKCMLLALKNLLELDPKHYLVKGLKEEDLYRETYVYKEK